MSTDVRVGIVSYETAEELRSCLAALPAALGGLTAEVVVVDNASQDHSREVVSDFPDVRLVAHTDNVGYARAMNVALSGTEARALIALNPDAVAEPGSLRRLVEVLDEDAAVGLSVPRLLNDDGSLQHSIHRFPSPRLSLVMGLLPPGMRSGRLGRRYWLEGSADHAHASDVDWAVGAVHCMRRNALGRDAPYSERSFMYMEDMEICWHVRSRGWLVRLEPSSVVSHTGNVAGERAFGVAREERWIDALYDWYVAEHGPLAARGYAAATCLGLLVKAAVLRARGGPPEHKAQVEGLLRIHSRRILRPRSTGLSRLPPS